MPRKSWQGSSAHETLHLVPLHRRRPDRAPDHTIRGIEDALHTAGHETICSVWEEGKFTREQFTPRQILEWAPCELDTADAYFVFVKSPERSEGMLLEAGYALAKKKRFIVAAQRDITTTFLRHLADTLVEYDTYEDLQQQPRHVR